MKMDGQIRVETEKKYAQLYNDLKGIVCTDFHELFFVCACLGYKHHKRKSLGGGREERFWSRTIKDFEWACYYAMLLNDTLPNIDYSVVQNDKAVIQQVQEYANAGIELLIDGLLCDYLVKGTREPKLDVTASEDLANRFLHFIFEETELQFGRPL